MDKNIEKIIEQIRKGNMDVNSQSLFFSLLSKNLVLNLNNSVKIRDKGVPHYILHTGTDLQWLQVKGQDLSIEPYEISNEDYVYSEIPRCIVQVGGVNLLFDQLTNPFIIGNLQLEYEDKILSLAAEVRRMPIKVEYTLTYEVSGYLDLMELIQQIICNLSIIRIFNIQYLGQQITCSYTLPSNYNSNFLMEVNEDMQESKTKTLQLQIEVESNLPIYDNKTIMSWDNTIQKFGGDVESYKKDGINNDGAHQKIGGYKL